MKCPYCGHENRQDARFCQVCGADLTTTSPPSGPTASRRSTRPLSHNPTPPPSKRGGKSATRPLPRASIAFAPLPEGALLHDGRYAVVEIRETSAQLNVYLVMDTAPVRICSNCRTEATDPQERFCASCGADISGLEPLHLHYVVRESSDERAFTVEAQLLELGVEHPGLLLPRDTFIESPYGPPRHYLIEPEFTPPPATSIPVPQELNQVLEWGVSLAQALDYLHSHHITLREVGLNQIGVERKKKALWTHLGTAYAIPPAERQAMGNYFARDLQGLAAVLLYLATGDRQVPPTQLPEQAALAFSQALTAPTKITAADFAAALETALEELRHPASITLVVGRRTDVGQERSLNEDSLLTVDIAPVYRSISRPVGLFVVADGMGGHEAGDVASRLAIQAIGQQAVNGILAPATSGEPLADARQWLSATVLAANRSVYDHRKAAGTDMGTTLVMALLVGDTATIANIGDSRAYLLKPAPTVHDGAITQITTDHSLVERLVATGQITREEAINHPQRNVIYRVIGDKPRTEADLFEQRLAPGEALLLCSDGLSGMVRDEQIWNIWRTSTSPQDACDRLIEAANQAGGEDNITAVIVQVAG